MPTLSNPDSRPLRPWAPRLCLSIFSLLYLSTGATAQSLSGKCVTPVDDLVIHGDTTLCPGSYSLSDAAEDGLIRVAGSDLVLNLADARIEGDGAGYGVVADGVSNVTIEGHSTGGLSGFRSAILLENGSGHRVQNLDLSHNRKRTIFDNASDFLAVWPDWDDQVALDQIGNGVVLRNVSDSEILNNTMRHQQNGIGLFRSDGNNIERNNCSDNQGWGIHLHRSSSNTVLDNIADNNHLEASPWCVTNQEAGCDTAAILVIKASHDNLVRGNSLRNSGDGVFSAAREGSIHWGADRNRYLGNDVSLAKHIGIESTFSDQNELIHNIIQGCGRYGVWLGYSRNALIRGNRILDNTHAGIANESADTITVEWNNISGNGVGVQLWEGTFPGVAQQSRAYTFVRNSIANNLGFGLRLEDTHVVDASLNDISNNAGGNIYLGANEASAIEGPIRFENNNILGLDLPYNVLTSCCEASCRACDGNIDCCNSFPGCAYYSCSDQCHPTGTSNCDAGCSCDLGTEAGSLGAPTFGTSVFDTAAFDTAAFDTAAFEAGLPVSDIADAWWKSAGQEASGCRDHDGNVKGCDAAPGCSYYACSDQCHPTGTSNCGAGCSSFCDCRAHDGDLQACNAEPGCAYYSCSDQCHPEGTSECDAGCEKGCEGDFCDWAAVTDLSDNWWGTTDSELVGAKICGDLPFLPIRKSAVR